MLQFAYFFGAAIPVALLVLLLSGAKLGGNARTKAIFLISLIFVALIISALAVIAGMLFDEYLPIKFDAIKEIPKELLGIKIAAWISFALVSAFSFLIAVFRGIKGLRGRSLKWEDVRHEKSEEEEKQATVEKAHVRDDGKEIFDRRLKEAEEHAERKIEKQEIRNIIVEKAQRAPTIIERKMAEGRAAKTVERSEQKMDAEEEKRRILERIKQKLKEVQSETRAKEPENQADEKEGLRKAIKDELKSLAYSKEGKVVASEEEGKTGYREEMLPSLEEITVPAKKFKAEEELKKEQPKKKGLFSGMFKKK